MDEAAAQRAALVTGAGGGIGEGIAVVLADRGWRVAVNDINADAADRVAATIGGVAVAGDASNPPARIVERAVEAMGRLDGLVNNVGIHRRSPLADASVSDLDELYRVNLRSAVTTSQDALDHLQASRGSIVCISSIAALTPQMGVSLYTATKAGLSAFVAQASVEWGPLGIRVNAVAPGMVRTAMAEAVYADADLFAKRQAMVPVGRIGTPADIGRAVAFLLSDDASYITGQTLVVDGGFTRVLIDQLPHPGA